MEMSYCDELKSKLFDLESQMNIVRREIQPLKEKLETLKAARYHVQRLYTLHKIQELNITLGETIIPVKVDNETYNVVVDEVDSWGFLKCYKINNRGKRLKTREQIHINYIVV